jgi:hypothetical protein
LDLRSSLKAILHPCFILSNLEWFWVRSDPNRIGPPGLPQMRPLTRLCEKNKQAFRDDFRDYGNAEGRDIAMLGLQPDSRGLVKPEANLKKALHRFATEGAGPVQAVFVAKRRRR